MREFTAFILDQLYPLQPIAVKRMFGAECLFRFGKMFAIIEQDQLYLKTNAETAPHFIQAGCLQFSYLTTRKGEKKPVYMCYYQVPETALEDAEALLHWVKLSLQSNS